jgi:hypothetical protein
VARSAVGEGKESSARLVASIHSYLTEHPAAAVLDNGQLLFDMRCAKYAVAESHGRCVLQFWNEERNLVRTVIAVDSRGGSLKITTRRMGASRPETLELTPTSERRTPTARDAARRQYLRLLERVLQRHLPECKTEGFRAAADLEHSFGPAFVRGLLLRGSKGMAAEAVVGVSAAESASTIDGALTLGLLWLDYCREHPVRRGTRHVGGLKIIVPAGSWRTTAERMAWLNPGLASYQLFTLDERTEELIEIDYRDVGNVTSRLVHAFDVKAALERAHAGIERVLECVPASAQARVEIRANAASEIGLLLHGLEFARVRQSAAPNSFGRQQEITFGAGSNETPLNQETEHLCRNLLAQLFASRYPDGTVTDALFRLQPERWLESRIRTHLADFLPDLRPEFLYSQVPAIGAGERGMLDLLTIDREGRLTILEVKADEDMHLPLQGLDYWIRVRALNADRHAGGPGPLERQGYFTGAQLSEKPPKLLMIAPALRIHPSNEIVLRYLSPHVEWELIAVGEHWRRELKTIFRKRSLLSN